MTWSGPHAQRRAAGGRPRARDAGRRRRRAGLVVAELAVVAVIAAAIVVLVTSGGRTPSHSARPPAPRPPFAADSVWNAPVPADAPLTPQSATYVHTLQQQLAARGAWINTTNYSVPVYTVGPHQPLVHVTLDQSGPNDVAALARAFAAGVPIPPGAHAAAGTDQSMVVYQPSRNTLWEFWRAHRVNGVWHAYWGGKMTDVSGNPGYFTTHSGWGGSGTSLSLLGGLMTIADLRAGQINHALAMAIPTAATRFVYPAQRSDGHDTSPAAIPEGTRFRLDPHLNIAALHLPPITRMIAEAAQRYGMIVRDQAGSVALYAQDPAPTGADPYSGPHGLFDGLSPQQVLRGFPWSRLEVVSPGWHPG